jgi:HEAT repeat protein
VRMRICVVMFLCSLALAGCSKEQSTDDLIEDLSSADEGDRIKAVRWLQQRKGDASKVVPALIESLKDTQADIRWSAAIGLGYFGAEAEDAIPALEGAQRDNDARVREAARVAISRIEGQRRRNDE